MKENLRQSKSLVFLLLSTVTDPQQYTQKDEKKPDTYIMTTYNIMDKMRKENYKGRERKSDSIFYSSSMQHNLL